MVTQNDTSSINLNKTGGYWYNNPTFASQIHLRNPILVTSVSANVLTPNGTSTKQTIMLGAFVFRGFFDIWNLKFAFSYQTVL